MSLLKKMLPGQSWRPGVIAQMLPGTAPDPVVAALAGIPVEDGVAFVPVPGARGERGLPGEVGAGLNVAFPTPLAEWLINHNLGYQPSVQTFTAGGQEVEGAVLHLSVNQTRISFAGPLSGSARLV